MCELFPTGESTTVLSQAGQATSAQQELALFVSVVTGTLILHADDRAILRLCLAAFINFARHFRTHSALNRFSSFHASVFILPCYYSICSFILLFLLPSFPILKAFLVFPFSQLLTFLVFLIFRSFLFIFPNLKLFSPTCWPSCLHLFNLVLVSSTNICPKLPWVHFFVVLFPYFPLLNLCKCCIQIFSIGIPPMCANSIILLINTLSSNLLRLIAYWVNLWNFFIGSHATASHKSFHLTLNQDLRSIKMRKIFGNCFTKRSFRI